MMLQFALQPEVNLLYIFPMSVSCPQKPAASFNLSESCRVRVEAFTPNNSQCSTGGAEWFRNWSTYSWNWSRCFFESSPRNALLIVILFFYWYLPVPTILPIIPVNRKASSVFSTVHDLTTNSIFPLFYQKQSRSSVISESHSKYAIHHRTVKSVKLTKIQNSKFTIPFLFLFLDWIRWTLWPVLLNRRAQKFKTSSCARACGLNFE